MAYECTICGHPDWAHSIHYCRQCIEQLASHEFTVDKPEQNSVHLHGKLSEQKTVAHEYAETGTACSDECPACRLLRVRAAEQREKIKQPPHAIVLSSADVIFLTQMKVSRW